MKRWLMIAADYVARGFGLRLGTEAAEELTHVVGDEVRELL